MAATVVRLCADALVPCLDVDSFASLIVTSRAILDHVIETWWHRWTVTAFIAIDGAKTKDCSNRMGRSYHLNIKSETWWWHTNRLVSIFHAVARWRAPRAAEPAASLRVSLGHLTRVGRRRTTLVLRRRRADPRRIRRGYLCDARDRRGFWSGAVVLDVESARVRVRYTGWSSKFNEWVSLSSIAPHGSRSLQWTGYRVRPRQYCLVHRRQLLCAMHEDGPPLAPCTEPLCGYTFAEITDVYTATKGPWWRGWAWW